MSTNPSSPFKVLVVTTIAKDHVALSVGARPYFAQLGADNGFDADFTDEADDIDRITDENLAQYAVVVVLNRAPFDMTADQQAALQRFIESGKGWIGIHGAGLTGKQFQSPARPYWQWFEDFLGGVTYSPHPAYQKGTVAVEDREHPATRNLPERFEMTDEWYEFHENPRGRVRVLATADESTYKQNKPMGDHPLIWTHEAYRRMIYIAVGHDTTALANENYSVLLRDSLLWAAS